MTGRFTGKSVVVTGAASGIGLATARLFASEGASVLAMDLSERLDEAVGDMAGVTPVRGDAGSEQDVIRIVGMAIEEHGAIDVFIANAGVSGGSPGLFDTSPEEFAELLRINLIGPYLAIKHAAPRMTAGGAIVCTASVAGLRAGAGSLAYSASKAGVINLVQTAAQQLTGSGIRINAVCPGLIETGMTGSIYDRARSVGKEDRLGMWTPLQRGGEPAEIAAAFAFLASEEASYITGHALVVDGGLSSSHPFGRRREFAAPIL